VVGGGFNLIDGIAVGVVALYVLWPTPALKPGRS